MISRPPTPRAARERRSSPWQLRRSYTRYAVAALSLLLLGTGAGCPGHDQGPPPDAWVQIGSKRVAVELAETASDQTKGLGYRDGLAWDHGMYFVYERAGFYGFWMKGMRFSIDIVWIRQGRIVDLHRDVPFEPGGNGPTVRPRELVDAVLEVPAGYAAASGWSVGDRVTLERTGSPQPINAR